MSFALSPGIGGSRRTISRWWHYKDRYYSRPLLPAGLAPLLKLAFARSKRTSRVPSLFNRARNISSSFLYFGRMMDQIAWQKPDPVPNALQSALAHSKAVGPSLRRHLFACGTLNTWLSVVADAYRWSVP